MQILKNRLELDGINLSWQCFSFHSYTPSHCHIISPCCSWEFIYLWICNFRNSRWHLRQFANYITSNPYALSGYTEVLTKELCTTPVLLRQYCTCVAIKCTSPECALVMTWCKLISPPVLDLTLDYCSLLFHLIIWAMKKMERVKNKLITTQVQTIATHCMFSASLPFNN